MLFRSVVVTGGSFVYNGSPRTATASVSGLGTGITQTVTWSYSGSCTSAPTTVAEGTSCSAKATYAGDANHFGSNDDDPITITQAPATISFSSLTKTYNGTAQSPTVTTSPTGLSFSSTGYPQTNANNTPGYAVTATINNPNYVATTTSNTFVINPAPVTATAGGGSSVYDGSTKTPAACVVTGTYKGDLTCTNNPATVGPGVSTTTTVPVVAGTGLSNFAITSVNGSYAISKIGRAHV